jgi:hypothetical protein
MLRRLRYPRRLMLLDLRKTCPALGQLNPQTSPQHSLFRSLPLQPSDLLLCLPHCRSGLHERPIGIPLRNLCICYSLLRCHDRRVMMVAVKQAAVRGLLHRDWFRVAATVEQAAFAAR